MKHFVEKLTEIRKDIFEKINVNEPMDELTVPQDRIQTSNPLLHM